MAIDEGYLTTCDLDEPHYRMQARRMDIYVKDKAIVHDMKIYLGKVPVMYLPYYVQDLNYKMSSISSLSIFIQTQIQNCLFN